MTTDPESPRSRNPEVSPALDSVVLRAMCRDRDQRYRTAGEFAGALQLAIEHPDEVQWTRPAHSPPLTLPPAVAAASQASMPPGVGRSGFNRPISLPAMSSRSLSSR